MRHRSLRQPPVAPGDLRLPETVSWPQRLLPVLMAATILAGANHSARGQATLPVVRVSTTVAVAAEAGPVAGVFTLSRTGDPATALAVNILLAGAAKAADYEPVVTPVTFAAGESNAVVSIIPVDDREAELTESVLLTLRSGAGYTLAGSTNAVLHIVDNEPPTMTVFLGTPSIYEAIPFDTARLLLIRLGDTNVALIGVTYSMHGTALAGQDYVSPSGGLTFPAGVVTGPIELAPIDDFELEGPETIVLTLDPSPEYVIGSPSEATIVLRDDEQPPAPVLFADDFETNSSSAWAMRFGASNGLFDATVLFATDYSLRNIPPAPRSAPGATRGLFVQVNKNDALAASAGINLHPLGQHFRGDYALRFDMFLGFGAVSPAEHAIAGLNHSGLATNRFGVGDTQTTRGGDGLWVGINANGSGVRDYAAYTTTNPASPPTILTNRPASGLAAQIPSPPYSVPGAPGNRFDSPTPSWAEVELSQQGGLVTLRVNDHVIFALTNTTDFTEGNVMLGLNDQSDAIGSMENFVLFDNVTVVSLELRITLFELLPDSTARIEFVAPTGGTPDAFSIESTVRLPAQTWDLEPATITSLGDRFRALVPHGDGIRFYRVRRIR